MTRMKKDLIGGQCNWGDNTVCRQNVTNFLNADYWSDFDEKVSLILIIVFWHLNR